MTWALLVATGLAAIAAIALWRRTAATTAREARAWVERGARLVDVRSPAEFAAGHLDGAINVPVGEVAGRAAEIGSLTTPVVVYCRSGVRSASAARSLRKLGFTDVLDLGAMSRW